RRNRRSASGVCAQLFQFAQGRRAGDYYSRACFARRITQSGHSLGSAEALSILELRDASGRRAFSALHLFCFSQFSKINSQLLALLVEVTSLESQRACGIGHVIAML